MRIFIAVHTSRVPDFSIVIPTYNNLQELQGCLSALGQTGDTGFEVFVCIDGSTDKTRDWLAQTQFPFPLKALEHPGGANRGRSATRNLALPHLSGEYVLFLDSDMQAEEGFLQAHLRQLRKGSTISIGGIRYTNAGQNCWARYLSERGVGKFGNGEQVPFNYFITAHSALPAEWFREVGGFDEAINGYGGEDMEFAYRIQQRYQPRFVHNLRASVHTRQDKRMPEALRQLAEYGAGGLPYIIRKHPELDRIYWVRKAHSGKIGDRLFTLLTRAWLRAPLQALCSILPCALRKPLINYLVISHVHKGFRSAKS